MVDITQYYKFRQTVPDIPNNAELYAVEHRGFLVCRENSEFILWEVRNLDNSKPVIPLRGSFTTKTKATDQIDSFLAAEARNQAASQTKVTQ
jgi:hypothetical protein